MGQNSSTYTLKWFGPEDYQVEIRQLPSSFFDHGHVSKWTLIRKGSSCVLSLGSESLRCPAPRTWGKLELSANPNEAAAALKNANIIKSNETSFTLTHSKNFRYNSPSRPTLALGRNGTQPISVLELNKPGQNNTAENKKKQRIHYDQNFFAPVLLESIEGGKYFRVFAKSNLKVTRDHKRYSPIVSELLKVFHEDEEIATLVRSPIEWSPQNKMVKNYPRGTLLPLSRLSNRLSSAGQMLLHALLVTH